MTYYDVYTDTKPEDAAGKWNYVRKFQRHEGTYAQPVKVWNISWPDEETRDKFLYLVGVDIRNGYWHTFEHMYIPDFELLHPGYKITVGGRSGGWLELKYEGYNNIAALDEEHDEYELQELFNILWDFEHWVVDRIDDLVDWLRQAQYVEHTVTTTRTYTSLEIPEEEEDEDA